jgi:hypothetical protein
VEDENEIMPKSHRRSHPNTKANDAMTQSASGHLIFRMAEKRIIAQLL